MPNSDPGATASPERRAARGAVPSPTPSRFGEQLQLFDADELLAELRDSPAAAAPLRRTA